MWIQRIFTLQPRKRGFHLVTNEILRQLPEISGYEAGLLNLFIRHTSASLAINENADPSVRRDFERVFNRLVPEHQQDYEHCDEGPDDLPAHIKASLLGPSLTVPVHQGRLALGVWQGIYLCEHRDHGGGRELVVTLQGENHHQ